MTLIYTILDNTYFEKKKTRKKRQIYIFIYKYTKILQFGALASWGLKNKLIISTKALFLIKKQATRYIYISILYFDESTPDLKEALRCAAKNSTPPEKKRFILYWVYTMNNIHLWWFFGLIKVFLVTLLSRHTWWFLLKHLKAPSDCQKCPLSLRQMCWNSSWISQKHQQRPAWGDIFALAQFSQTLNLYIFKNKMLSLHTDC